MPIAVALTLLAATAGAARPPDITARLDYTVPPGCPPASILSAEFARRIGYHPFVKDSPLLVVARITRRKGVLTGSMDLYDGTGALVWNTNATPTWQCEGMVVEMASALAFRFDPLVYPGGVSGEAPPAPPPAPTPPSPSSPPAPPVAPPPARPVAPPPAPPVAPPPRVALPPRSQTWTGVRFGLGAVLGFGAAPRATVGSSADLGVYVPATSLPFDGISLTPGLRWDPPAAGHVSGVREGARVNTSRYLLTVAPCVHWWKLYGCAVVGWGKTWGRGEDVAYSVQDSTSLPYFVGGGRLGVEVPFAPHLGFRVFGELLSSATTIEIPFNDQVGWTTPRASGSVGAGLYFFLNKEGGFSSDPRLTR